MEPLINLALSLLNLTGKDLKGKTELQGMSVDIAATDHISFFKPASSVPSKKILRWANIWFSEHEHFNAEFK